MLTIREVASRLRQHDPNNVEEVLRDCRLPLRFIESGAYRHAYAITGMPLVLKFPHSENQLADETEEHALEEAKAHSRVEASIVKRLRRRKRFRHLVRHLPRIYFTSERTGALLMHKYKRLPDTDATYSKLGELNAQIRDAMRVNDQDETFDMYHGNVARDEDGTLVMIDLGMFDGWD